ncbi:MAG: hypothetical protein AAB498_00665 [Patescibacteria group bacterium]
MLSIHRILSSIIKYPFVLLEAFIGIRVVLKFLDASERAIIVDLIYGLTDIFLVPFRYIFPNIYLRDGIVDIVAISAMIGYFIVVLAVLRLLDLLFLKK